MEHPCFLIRDSGRNLVLQLCLLEQSPKETNMLSWTLIEATQGYGQTSPPEMGISEDSNGKQSRDLSQIS